jgi:hypothetical protein
VEAGSIEQRALAGACAVAADHGVPSGEAVVINSASNVLVHLRPSPVVARVMTGTVALHDDPECWLSHEVAVLGFLAPSGLAVAPSPLIDPGPHRSGELWMTCWEWVEHRGRTELRDPQQLGCALRTLHDQLAGFAGELPGLLDLQHDVERLLRRLRPTAGLSPQKIEALQTRLSELGETVFGVSWPAQALHGDASLYNLLRGTSGRLVWNDFEDTFRGPVHWDLAGYLMSLEACGADTAFVVRALAGYGGLDREELAPFTAAHEVCDEIWRLYDAQRRS